MPAVIDPKAFLQNVLTSDDDASRLVYADWLEEQGDLPRADLIRAQCTLAAARPWDRAALEATWRTSALLAEHGARFRAELPVLEGVEWTDFERGFPSTVKVDTIATLYRHADAIGKAAPVYRAHLEAFDESADPYVPGSVPWLRALRITSPQDVHVNSQSSILQAVRDIEVVRVEEYQLLEWLTGRDKVGALAKLRVEGEHVVGRQFVDELARASWAKQLTTLAVGTRFVDYDSGYFTNPTLGAEGGASLATFGELEVLDVSRQRIRDDGLAAIFQKLPKLRELDARAAEATTLSSFGAGAPFERLDLSLNHIGNDGARAIAASPRTTALESLQLDTCEIGADGIRALAAAPLWSTLRVLDLSRNPIGTGGVQALSLAPPPAQLHTLVLADSDLTADAIETLAAIPWLSQLLVLDLSRNAIGAAAASLGKLAGGALRQLRLGNAQIADVAALAGVADQLVELDLSKNPIGDAGVAALVAAPAPELQTLALASCNLTGDGFRRICMAKLPRLRSLVVHRNELTPRSLALLLLESPLAPQLEHLDVSYTGQSPELADELVASTRLARLRKLEVRGVRFDERQMLALARCESLRGLTELAMTVDVWSFGQAAREELFARFSRAWWYVDNDGDEDVDAE